MAPAPRAAVAPDRLRRFDALVTGFGRLVAHAVRRVAGAAAANDVEDIQQDVMVALWRRLDGEQTIEHPASYVYRAAVREAVRAVQRRRRLAEEPLEGTAAAQVVVEGDAVARLERRDERAALAAAIEGLAPDRARAVRAHLSGLSTDEMMRLYGWTYQRARNLVTRGLADVKAAVRGGGAER